MFGTPPAAADDKGTTVTRLDYNADNGHLEAAIRARPEQLEKALGAYFGSPSSFRRGPDDGPEAEALLERRLERYVRDTVFIESISVGSNEVATEGPDEWNDGEGSGTPWTPTWVGFEIESPRRAWLYVEFSPPAGLGSAPTRLRISQRMFFETGAQQSNTVRLRVGDVQKAFNFTPEVAIRVLDLSPDEP